MSSRGQRAFACVGQAECCRGELPIELWPTWIPQGKTGNGGPEERDGQSGVLRKRESSAQLPSKDRIDTQHAVEDVLLQPSREGDPNVGAQCTTPPRRESPTWNHR